MALKAYLPPEGPQNLHGVQYNYMEGQQAHRVGNTVIRGPEEIILTGSEDAHRELRRWNLEPIEGEDAETLRDHVQEWRDADSEEDREAAREDLRDTISGMDYQAPGIEEADSEETPTYLQTEEDDGQPETEEGDTPPVADEPQSESDAPDTTAAAEPPETEEAVETEDLSPEEAPVIPENLDTVPYRGDVDVTLQGLAQAYGIKANQEKEDLIEALDQERENNPQARTLPAEDSGADTEPEDPDSEDSEE